MPNFKTSTPLRPIKEVQEKKLKLKTKFNNHTDGKERLILTSQ
jgi:hypothetical protein